MTITFSSTITIVPTTTSTIVSTTSLTTIATTPSTVLTTSSTIVSTTSLTTVTTKTTVRDLSYEESRYSNGRRPIAIAVADVNHDNVSDVFISYIDKFYIEITFHGSNGTILSRKKHHNNAAAVSIALGDINDDNKLDIVTLNVHYGSCSVGISFNTDDGSFTIPREHRYYWNDLKSVAVVDFDGDNNLDVAIVSAADIGYGNGRIYLLRNTGGDYLACCTTYDVGRSPSSIAVDNAKVYGGLSIVVTNNGARTVTFFRYYGIDRDLYFRHSDHLVHSPSSVGIADLNNDGHLDIVITFSDYHLVGVLLNDCRGYFFPLVTYITDGWSKSVMIADLNGDYKNDIITGSFDVNTISVLLNIGNGTFLPRKTYRVSKTPQVIAIIDANNDNKPDIIYANEHSDYVGILLHC
ncbi:unnamed protein product [Adineta ricciae]|uniref:Uncharacterized protein n=1 Tax=Adineta ricciae TaxID=249248 RepID=A0A813WTD0_ADIRI|nr:unnamed protein product [Adineta ricciae]CAF1503346.1 unnamed protein product [Adineta ricciae]